jgi:hypothetical protein
MRVFNHKVKFTTWFMAIQKRKNLSYFTSLLQSLKHPKYLFLAKMKRLDRLITPFMV